MSTSSSTNEFDDDSDGSDDNPDAAELAELLNAACIAGDVESVQSLLPYFDAASANLAGGQGATPLHSSAFNGHIECMEALLTIGVDVNCKEERGCTPLFLAAQAGHSAAAAVLLEHGADATCTCALGSTPLDAAKQNGWPGVVRVLCTHVGASSEQSRREEALTSSNAASGECGQRGADIGDMDGDPLAKVPPEFAAQAARMPLPLRRLIVCGVPPSDVTAAAVIHALRLPITQFRSASAALAPRKFGSESPLLMRLPNLLDAEACSRLRAAVSANAHAMQRADSVDGLADHQLNLTSLAELERYVGSEAMKRLQEMPRAFFGRAGLAGVSSGAQLAISQIFIRRYAHTARPWFGFHRDTGPLTVNVALADDSLHQGGRLLGLMDGEVRLIERREGEGTVHPSTLLHGVSRMLEGPPRFSLICFYREQQAKQRQQADHAGGEGLNIEQ